MPVQTIPEAEFSKLDTTEQVRQAVTFVVPESLPIDLKSKLTVCLIHIGEAQHLVQPFVDALLELVVLCLMFI